MTSRQIRRAEERRTRKLARKGVAAGDISQEIPPVEAVAAQLTPEPEPQTDSPRTRAEINRENARYSTGPRTSEGRARSSMNHFKHGFRGHFSILPSESKEDFDRLLANLRHDHQPANTTEDILVERMAQHHWLSQRAIHLQTTLFSNETSIEGNEKAFSLYLRYQTANERAFSKCLHDLLKLRAEARKAENEVRKVQLESQKQEQKRAEKERKQNPTKFDQLCDDLEEERLRDLALIERICQEVPNPYLRSHAENGSEPVGFER